MAAKQEDFELASKSLSFPGSKLELALRRNDEGLFLKIASLPKEGGINKCFVGSPYILKFVSGLHSAAAACATLPESGEARQDQIWTAKILVGSNRIFFLDIRLSSHGRYLRLSSIQSGRRSVLLLPTEGSGSDADGEGGSGGAPGSALNAVASAIVDMISSPDVIEVAPELTLTVPRPVAHPNARRTSQEERNSSISSSGAGDGVSSSALGADTTFSALSSISRHMRVAEKKYYFDVDRSSAGPYLRLSEVTGSGARSSVVVPLTGIPALHSILSEYVNALMQALPGATAAQVQQQVLSALSGGNSHLGHGLFGVFVGDSAARSAAAAPTPAPAAPASSTASRPSVAGPPYVATGPLSASAAASSIDGKKKAKK